MPSDPYPERDNSREGARFGAELAAFAGWLEEQRYLRDPINAHLSRIQKALDRSDRFESGTLFKEEDVRELFTVSGPGAYRDLITGRIFIRFLAATGRLTPVETVDPKTLLWGRYQQYLAEVRGFADNTLKHHRSTVADFLSHGVPPDRGIAGLAAADVEAYLQFKSKNNKRQSLQHVVARLRAFLRYCGERGEAPAGLDVIDTPRVYRGELPPRALDWQVVRRLLASIRRRTPRDWRDYTILHLMAYYGLRPSEVATLHLTSIDWEARTLRVDQRKTRSLLVLPLADRTLRLLRCYLALGRQKSDSPYLFLRARSPICALMNYGIIEIFHDRVKKSNLPLDGASPYSLRHAFAMRLLRRGVGIKAIGDLLGHRSLEATCVYLRIDTDMLRTVALPLPAITVV